MALQPALFSVNSIRILCYFPSFYVYPFLYERGVLARIEVLNLVLA